MTKKHIYVIVSEGRVTSIFSDSEDIDAEVIDLDDADASDEAVRIETYKEVKELKENHTKIF